MISCGETACRKRRELSGFEHDILQRSIVLHEWHASPLVSSTSHRVTLAHPFASACGYRQTPNVPWQGNYSKAACPWPRCPSCLPSSSSPFSAPRPTTSTIYYGNGIHFNQPFGGGPIS